MAKISLRNACNQCRQAKVRCAFEPSANSSCLRCIRRGSDCTRNPPLPLGRRPSSSCGISRRKNSTRAMSGAPKSNKHEPITPESSTTPGGSSSPTIPHGGLAAFKIGPPRSSSNKTSGGSCPDLDGSSCWDLPTDVDPVTSTPHELAPVTSPTTDASAFPEYSTIPLEWFSIETPICVRPPDERSGRSSQPAAATAEEALLPPPPSPPPTGSPPSCERGPLPGYESNGGSSVFGDNGSVCLRCSEDAADAIAALQGSRVSFDYVLRRTKIATAVLARFCACAGYHEASDRLLICFLAQKTVTAYRQALCTCGMSARNLGAHVPEIRIGSYRIVGEEGLLLMRQVVVVELRRLRRMVEQLGETMRDGGASDCDNAHSLLQGFLQAELRSVLTQVG